MQNVVTNVTGGEGNTKSSPPSKGQYTYFCFTKFYESDDDIIKFEKMLQKICIKYYFGKEICPKTNNKHLQGFMQMKKKTRISEFKKYDSCHIEPTKGSQDQNEEYCGKDGDITKYGYPKPIKIISKLYDWQLDIEKLSFTEPDGRHIYWYYDTIGGKGKSSFCKYMVVKHSSLVIQGGKLSDVINIIYNSDMDKINTVIIDIPRNNGNNISYNAVECILNGMITNTKFETGVKIFNPPHVIVFSNYEPDTNKLSKDRWVIKCLNES